MSEPYGTTNKKLNVNGETRTVRYRGFPDLDNVRNYTKTRKHDRIYGSYDYITYDCDYNVYIDGKEYTATRHSTQGSGGTQQTFEYNGVTVGSEKKLAELILSTENNISDSKQLKHKNMRRVKDAWLEDAPMENFSAIDGFVNRTGGDWNEQDEVGYTFGIYIEDDYSIMTNRYSYPLSSVNDIPDVIDDVITDLSEFIDSFDFDYYVQDMKRNLNGWLRDTGNKPYTDDELRAMVQEGYDYFVGEYDKWVNEIKPWQEQVRGMYVNDSRRVKDSASNPDAIIDQDYADEIESELQKVDKKIEIWRFKSSENRVVISTLGYEMYERNKKDIHKVMSDSGYVYNKSFPLSETKAYVIIFDKKVSDSRRVKDSFDFPEFDDLIKKYGRDEKFLYRLLSRMQTDCEYYLGNGGRYDAHLWALNPDKQIKYMIAIWDYLPEKPEWLPLDQLEKYSVEMTGKTLSDFGYNNTISDSRCVRSFGQRIKDSVKAKSVRKRINDAIDKYFRKDLKNLQAYRRVTDAEGKIKEDVVFLIEDGDVLAVFPNTYGTADRDKDTMVCYAHMGQHSTCTYDYANTLKTASESEYKELYDELSNYVGYDLNVLKSLPSEAELKQNGKEIRDSYIRFRRGLQAIDDARMLARGEEIEYKGKRGTVQYALFHGQQPVIIRWQNEDGSEEFEVPYNQVASLKVSDSEDDVNIEQADSDLDDAEVTDGCGKKGKKKAKKTADAVKKVKITKRQTKKAE